ncbi:hypothetical protein Dimus_020817 [Dionaea muscipula]
MALMNLQRRNFVFGSASAVRFPSSSMAQLQHRTTYSSLDAHLVCSPFCIGDTYRNCSQLRYKKIGFSCKMAVYPQSLRLDRQQHSHLSNTITSGIRHGTSYRSPSRSGFANHPRYLSVSNFMPYAELHGFWNSIELGPLSVGAVLRRAFSVNPELELQAMNASESRAKDGKAWYKFMKFRGVRKHRTWVKGTTARGSNSDVPPSTSTSHPDKESVVGPQLSANKESNVSAVTASTSKADPEPKLAIKQNLQPRSKKKKAKASGALSTSDIVSSKGSGVSSTKINKNSTENQPSPAAENSSSGKILVEVADVSVTTKPLSKKTTKNRSRAGSPRKAADAILETNGSAVKPVENMPQVPSNNHSLQKSKPPKYSKIKARGPTFEPLFPASAKSVVVVESVAKAKVIQGYLGDMYEVLPSHGHIRDLAARSGSVRPDEDFSMVWEVPSSAWTHLKSIKAAIIGARNLILASDPDREGEAIAWHIVEMLVQQDALHKDLTVARVVFQEITETAIKGALQRPREIDINLVHAYLARRAIDYLIGFNISPILWRKLPGCSSAGRVQSAALSLICDTEIEIDEFKPKEYWTVEAIFKGDQSLPSTDNNLITSYLTRFDSQKLNQLSVTSENEAKEIEQSLHSSIFKVIDSKRSRINKNPPSPFITATLQQDAANKLRFSATYTMKLAQKLYEGVQLSDGKGTGLITYIRTDGLHLSDQAAKDISSMAIERYGQRFVSSTPRKYFRKVKNAQEAHEAIRPTDIRRLPSTLVGTLDEDSLKLYTLIWSRTMACQMESAKIEQIQVDIGNDSGSTTFRATSSRIQFPGYRAVYEDGEAEAISNNESGANDSGESFKILSSLKLGDQCTLDKVEIMQHHTQPPHRYSEASLIKKLEELGIGRPSTYASTLKVLQDRKYVTVKSRVLYPEFRGRMVSAFLADLFSEVTDYSFTADMETELDNVSAGLTEWKGLLRDYWTRFSGYCERASKVQIRQVEKMLEQTFSDFLFSSLPNESRTCPSCFDGTLIMRISRYGEGYFIGCDQHPNCKYIAKTICVEDEDETTYETGTIEQPKLLGTHPVSKLKVFLKKGPYGYYVQLGEDQKGHPPKRSPVPQLVNTESLTLEDAVELLRYPKTLGKHLDGQPIVLKIGKSGFAIKHRQNFVLVPKQYKPHEVTIEIAMELLKSKAAKKSGRPKGKSKAVVVEVD